MANSQRGEIDAKINGSSYTLCLTLGALAELESALEVPDIVALAERFSSGRISAGETIAIIGAGLRGGGNVISDAELSAMHIEGGAMGAATLAATLLKTAFDGND